MEWESLSSLEAQAVVLASAQYRWLLKTTAAAEKTKSAALALLFVGHAANTNTWLVSSNAVLHGDAQAVTLVGAKELDVTAVTTVVTADASLNYTLRHIGLFSFTLV
jgi:hypothetical protein